MLNTCEIQLFDAETGKLKEQCVAENIINNYVNLYASKLLGLYDVLTYLSTVFARKTAFGQIVLSDYAGAEDADLASVKGNVVGWADKYTIYAGTDPRRGSVNLAETNLVTARKVKFVFDFPTNAANGTFQTVFWSPSDHPSATTEQYQPLVAHGSYYSSNAFTYTPDYGPMEVISDKLYLVKSNIVYSVKIGFSIPKLFRDNNTFTIEADLSAIDSAIRGIQWDPINSKWWVYGHTADKFFRLNSDFTVDNSYSVPAGTYLNDYNAWTLFQENIYTTRYVSTTVTNVFKWSVTDMTLQNTVNITTPGRSWDTYATHDNQFTITHDANNLILIQTSNGTNVRGSSKSVVEISTNGEILADYGCYLDFFPTAIAYNSEYNMFESGTGHIFDIMKRPVSQTLLPAPITKTSSDFMKIAFTFDISALQL